MNKLTLPWPIDADDRHKQLAVAILCGLVEANLTEERKKRGSEDDVTPEQVAALIPLFSAMDLLSKELLQAQIAARWALVFLDDQAKKNHRQKKSRRKKP